jgi:hypothetical protein
MELECTPIVTATPNGSTASLDIIVFVDTVVVTEIGIVPLLLVFIDSTSSFFGAKHCKQHNLSFDNNDCQQPDHNFRHEP